jgi:alpha-D-ribose 1-methylphosphonate 5-triphosphate synthase subunit PhnG
MRALSYGSWIKLSIRLQVISHMFQAVDNAQAGATTTRRDWMGLLARAPLELLESAVGPRLDNTSQWLRAPETGLMMVQGRVGGTGERFNLGEVTVTRCALRVGDRANTNSKVGVAYVMGRSHRRAQLAALADALLQDVTQHAALDRDLLTPAREHLERARAQRYARAQTTKVDFFTVAREAKGTDNDEKDEE